ncbi:Leucine rich repeat-containing protein [Butyrivibrio sp. ob235]|uniref:leucine-rich repeat protein n=1 Tax=Butyrivibrio sp. ob235 TaxID=1761780 RepID=UPI0008CCF791|nr:leucine-rich repeat protein [Butyrivibrio sp. ob235]SEK25539.1 Leucine rich repeat-containing protein [Butyrivibrio sp. ob235]
MMRMIKRAGAFFLAFSLALSMTITLPILSFVSYAADTAEVDFKFDDSSVKPGKFVLKNAFDNYVKADAPINVYFEENHPEEVKGNVDAGYDLFAVDCGFSGIYAANYTEWTEYDAIMTMPIPDGYAPASLKMVYQFHYKNGDKCEYKNKVEATSYTENTATIPLKMMTLAKGALEDWTISSHVYVELKKFEDLSTKTATLSSNSYDYTGSPIVPEVTIPGLVKDKDFTVVCTNNIEPGTATVTVTGKGIYKGTITLQFTINKKEYKQEEVNDEKTGASYVVTTNADGTIDAIYKTPTDKKAKKITIPENVTLPDGSTAKVTQIAPKAFKDSKATQITIPKSVKKISAKAFEGSSAKKIILKTDAKGKVSIGKGAFKKMKAKKTTIQIKGCKGNAKKKLSKQVKKQASSGTTVK